MTLPNIFQIYYHSETIFLVVRLPVFLCGCQHAPRKNQKSIEVGQKQMRDLERELIGGNSISEKTTSPQDVQFISIHILIYLFEKLISDLVLGIG